MNWDKIEQLLNIAHKAHAWPTLKSIHDKALEELHLMQEHTLGPPKAEPVTTGSASWPTDNAPSLKGRLGGNDDDNS